MSESPKKLEDVFKTVGLPPYTYVKPLCYNEVRADIQQSGKHLLIEGPSGTGKTCIAFKVFEEIGWSRGRDYEYISCRDENIETILRAFIEPPVSSEKSQTVIVIDDFHLLSVSKRAEIGSKLKRLSDGVFEHDSPPKAILIGIPTTGRSLLSDAIDLGPRLGTYVLPRASDHEIECLIDEGEKALRIIFEDRDILLKEISGNFWLAQYICHKVCATSGIFETQDDRIISFDMLSIRHRLMTELSQRYLPIARIFAKGKRWRPGGNKPYLEVLLALCKIPDSVVTFDKILNVVPDPRRPGIKAIRSRIAEVIFDQTKQVDLRKQIAFDPDGGFSIEDPLFRYFLSYLDPNELLVDLGIESDAVERSRRFSYDIGFSFAGETRQVVEAINGEMKAEDVITFYDFDQQAFLLALDLEETLRHIYSEKCRFYLVFLDRNYREKVWTKYEKDIMTGSGRKGHIIPVVLDDAGSNGSVGIPATIGRIDLRDLWPGIEKSGAVSADDINVLRNRCLLPLLEKLDTTV